MPASILEHLRSLQTRLRRLTWISGISSVLVCLLPALWVVGGIDWLLHLDDPGVRVILGLLVLAATAWICWKRLLTPLNGLAKEVRLALQIERRFPDFRDSLASAAQFQQNGIDPRIGSPELQRDLLEKTSAQLEKIGPADVMNVPLIRRNVTFALAAILVTTLLAVFLPQESLLAMTRLTTPFSHHPWPKQTSLRLVNISLAPLVPDATQPLKLVEGSDLEFYILNANRNGDLPRQLFVQLKQGAAPPTSEPVSRSTLAIPGQGQREVGNFRLKVKEPLQLRAVGGDDEEMPWISLETIPPPTVDRFQIEIIPPSYLGKPAQQLAAGTGRIEAIIGSKIRLQGIANRPLKSAEVVINDKTRQPARLDPDGKQLHVELTLADAGTFPWWWDVKDREGFAHPAPPKFELHVTPDKPPEIRLEIPASDLQVTATAEIQIRGIAKDDWGLKSADIIQRILTAENQQPVPPVKLPFKLTAQSLREETLSALLKLAELKLTAGQQLQIHLEATDTFDGTPPHLAKSAVRTITIVSAEQKRRELSDIQAGLLTELERAAKSQTEARAQVRELQQQWEKTGQLRPQDRDLLQRTEMQQRQVQTELTSPASGVLARAKDLLKQYRENALNDKETESQLDRLSEELQDLSREPFPLIEDALMRARKELADRGTTSAKPTPPPEKPKDSPPKSEGKPSVSPSEKSPEKQTPESKQSPDKSTPAKPSTAVAKSHEPHSPLHEAAEQQGVVRERLQGLIQEMTQWRDQRYAARQIEEMIANQEQVQKDTAELGQKTLGKGMSNLTPQEQADVSRLGERQQNLAERLDQLQKQIGKTLNRNSKASPDQQDTDKQQAEERAELRDFLEQAEKQGTAPLMQNAARDVAANNLGQAGKTQQDVLKQLKDLDDLLRNRAETDNGNLVKRLQQAQQELDNLQKQQQELLKQNEKAQAQTDAAQKGKDLKKQAEKQQQIRQSSEQLARRIRRLQSSAEQEMRQAAGRMNQAENSLQQESGSTAQEQQQTAMQHLEDAQKQLEQERREAEQQLAREKLREIQEQWKDLIARQQKALDQTITLHQAQQDKGQWNRVQLRTLGDLTKQQKELEQACNVTAKQLAGAEILSLALNRATQSMHAAGDLLQERQAGPVTQRAQRLARDRLQQVLDSFNQDPQEKNPQPQDPQGGAQAQQAPQGEDKAQMKISIPDLKVVRSLQQELNQRTDELSRELAARKSAPSPAVKQEMEQIAREQGELLQTLQKLITPAPKKTPQQTPAPKSAPQDVVPPPLPPAEVKA